MLPFAATRTNTKHIKGAYSLTPTLHPHQAIYPIPRMHPCTPPPLSFPPSLLTLPLSLPMVNFANYFKQTNFHCVSEAAHWTMWLRGKINAALSGRSNSICRFGLSHSVFITPNKSISCVCVCVWEKPTWAQSWGGFVCFLRLRCA